MINAYNSIVTYSEGDWENYLYKICLYDVFKELLVAYPDPQDFSCVVKYIVYAYSIDSDAIILSTDWLKNKQKIFEKAGIRPQQPFYEDLVHLKNPIILQTIQKWLYFQDNDLFEQLQILKDLRVEMQISCLSALKKSSDEIDYDQKYKNAQYSVELKKMIKELESELIQTSVKLKDSIKEFRSAEKKQQSFGLETILKGA